jgi:cytochrome d ubiquinol oxidase subunit II
MLADVPMVFILVGITAYTVLSGADFGAGLWTLIPGGGRASVAATREHTRHAIGPVWEANHVWLIFVLTVAWTCYPVAFGSIVSTLSIPLFIAAVGIIFRGSMYALRSQLEHGAAGVRVVEGVFALSSVLTPFALATVIGGIATGRVPVGNARGDLITSWLNPVSILAGVLAVAFSGYLAAVYLAADARRLTERALVHDFRARALVTGVLAGALALAGLFVVRASAPRYLWDGLTSGLGLALVCGCALAGVVTMVLVWVGRFALARASAALAVAAVIAGWAAAQEPRLLPGLTVPAAAAPRATLIATIIGVAAGALVLVPSLLLLYTLVLRGRLDTAGTAGDVEAEVGSARSSRSARDSGARGSGARGSGARGSGARPAGARLSGARLSGTRVAGAVAVLTLVAGVGLLVFGGPAWVHGLGALLALACAVIVFGLAAGPPEEPAAGPPERT